MNNFTFTIDKNKKEIQIDLQPCRKTIFFYERTYFLSFPKIRIISLYLLWVPDSGREIIISSHSPEIFFFNNKQKAVIPPLPNINRNHLCLKELVRGITFDDFSKNIIDAFFNSDFNISTTQQVSKFYSIGKAFEDPEKRIKKIDDLLKVWEDKTKADKNWIPDDFPEDILSD